MSYEQSDVSNSPAAEQTRLEPKQSDRQSTDAKSPEQLGDKSSAKPSGRDDDAARPATVLVRGETIREGEDKSAPTNSSSKNGERSKDQEKPARKAVSPAKVELQKRLPELADDGDTGVKKAQIVTRDGKADLAFTGTLIASAGPSSAPKGEWQEYRIYETDGGKHVFSKLTRNILAEQQDASEAEVFDPSPSSKSSQLLRSARDLTRTHPLTWTDAAVDFFGYDPLAKALYRKLDGGFEEHIS